MGSKRKKNLSRSQRNKKNYVRKCRSKKNVTSIPEQGNFSTGIHNALPSTSGTLQVTEELHNASNSQLRPYVDDSSDEDIEIMSPEHKRRLNDCLVKLVENMIPDEVLNILLAKKVLTISEMDTVKSKGIRMAMNEMLISLVTCKPDKAFSVLVEALKRSEQKNLAKLLTSTEYRKRKPAFEGNKDVTEDRKAVQAVEKFDKKERELQIYNIEGNWEFLRDSLLSATDQSWCKVLSRPRVMWRWNDAVDKAIRAKRQAWKCGVSRELYQIARRKARRQVHLSREVAEKKFANVL
ncbi:uncharacterized protein LOC115224053 [Octopus sinensis]|uniref:Uncharacterized protein LOC115224053 n=1 Tax=Octopus sinensis TaxID=2607531 RepID=A0A6P7TH78_9MOLL|nr:uncharacterized protein LOC115224053 [Octopus sinensis]